MLTTRFWNNLHSWIFFCNLFSFPRTDLYIHKSNNWFQNQIEIIVECVCLGSNHWFQNKTGIIFKCVFWCQFTDYRTGHCQLCTLISNHWLQNQTEIIVKHVPLYTTWRRNMTILWRIPHWITHHCVVLMVIYLKWDLISLGYSIQEL